MARDLALLVLAFAFLYDLTFLAAPRVTGARVALLIGVCLVWRRLWPALRAFVDTHPWFCLTVSFVTAYAALQFVVTGFADNTQLSRCVYFVLYSIVGATVFRLLTAWNLQHFLRLVTLATLTQAGFVFWSYLSPEYRVWLSETMVQGGNIPLRSGFQVAGFSNSSGAALSVIQATGAFAAGWAARRSASVGAATMYVVCATVIGASTALIGRTGVLMVVAFAGLLMLRRTALRVSIAVVVVILLLVPVLGRTGEAVVAWVEDRNPAFARTLEWGVEIFARGPTDPSVRELVTSPIPPLGLDTLVGTGRVVGPFGNASGHDSGYVQTYFALGLPVAVLFYLVVAWALLSRAMAGPDTFVLIGLVAALLVVEIKEPFIFKYALPFFAIAVTMPSLPVGDHRSAGTR